MSTLARVLFFVLLLALAVGPALAADSPPAALDVKHTQNVKVIPRWEVFEITFRHDGTYHNPFFDVTIDVTFTSPSGRKATVGGFHYWCLDKPEIILK